MGGRFDLVIPGAVLPRPLFVLGQPGSGADRVTQWLSSAADVILVADAFSPDPGRRETALGPLLQWKSINADCGLPDLCNDPFHGWRDLRLSLANRGRWLLAQLDYAVLERQEWWSDLTGPHAPLRDAIMIVVNRNPLWCVAEATWAGRPRQQRSRLFADVDPLDLLRRHEVWRRRLPHVGVAQVPVDAREAFAVPGPQLRAFVRTHKLKPQALPRHTPLRGRLTQWLLGVDAWAAQMPSDLRHYVQEES